MDLKPSSGALAHCTITYDQPKESPDRVKIFVFGVGTGVVDAAALTIPDAAHGPRVTALVEALQLIAAHSHDAKAIEIAVGALHAEAALRTDAPAQAGEEQ
jgi:hypothetical protein